MTRRTTVKMAFIRLLQPGHEPRRRHEKGFPPPPTIPFLRPYTFRSPIVVKVAPTTAGGNQSKNEIMPSLVGSEMCIRDRLAPDYG